ncbi:reverse transcriptase domain-containing protein, partial [Tanacetum coccineum]
MPFFKTLKKCTKKSDFQWTQESEVHIGTSNADCTKGKGGANHIPSRGQGSYQRSLNDRKGRQAIASVLCKPCPTRAGDQPIKQLLSKLEISGRMLKWEFELEGYDIQYRPMTSIKGQILADFIVERPDEESLDPLMTEPEELPYDIQYRPMTLIKGQILADFIVERPDEESPDPLMTEPEELPKPWNLFTDGSSCIDGSGAGLILTNPEGVEFTYAMRFRFEATNNEAEYEALI